jgi:hypothetical protein
MSFNSFIPEVWSAELQVPLEKAQVYTVFTNREYEGLISAAGDTVRITSISDPTISDYEKGQELVYEQLDTEDRILKIDQAKSFSFMVDDIDKRQAAGTVMSAGIERAGYRMADQADQHIASVYTDVVKANQLGEVHVTSADSAYKALLKLSTALDTANVQKLGRAAVLPPWYIEWLLQDQRFTAATFSGEPSVAVGGVTALKRVAGFDIFESNNCPVVNASHNMVLAGVASAVTFADQINQVEPLRLQKYFSDAVRGLHLYGRKLVRPDALATMEANPA